MHRVISTAAMAVVSVVLVGSAAAPAVASAGLPPGHHRSAGAPAETGREMAVPAARLLLINGDQLAVRPAGGQQEFVVHAASRADAVTGLRIGGQVLEIPTVALPFLGRGLSPSLFELSALKKTESGGRLPVRVTFAGHRPSLPGVRLTRSAHGVAQGYLTPASARRFGTALIRQFRSDHATGRYGHDGLFGHGVSITLAGSRPARRAEQSPAFKMTTLTVHATDSRGGPDTGDDVVIGNVDDAERLGGAGQGNGSFYHGSARFSVPAGHYWALATFLTVTRTIVGLRIVVVPQFTVTRQHSMLRMSARSASSEVTMTTPRSAVAQQTVFQILRRARAGGGTWYTQSWSGFPAWVSPTTRRPTVGSLRSYTSATLTSPRAASPGYAYNLDFPSPAGIVPPQHFAVRTADLGTVTERYYQDVPATGGWSAFGGTATQLVQGMPTVKIPVSMPQVQTQYFSAGRQLLWSLETASRLSGWADGDTDDFRWFTRGERQVQNWNKLPLHPAPDTTLGGPAGAGPALVSAGRIGNRLELAWTPFSDNQFGHLGAGFGGNANARVAGSYEVDQNGQKIAGGSALEGIPDVRLSASPATLRFVLTATRSGRLSRLSHRSQTVWTWRSASDPAARVPAAWYCGLTRAAAYVRQCAVQPLMTLSYDVRGMSLAGLTRPGRQVVEVTAGHIQLGGAALITRATAQVSFSAGHHWRPAAVTSQSDGRFKISFRAPAGAYVTLRVHATDAARRTITETIWRGYRISADAAVPAAARPPCASVPRGHTSCSVLVSHPGQAAGTPAARPSSRPRGWTPREIERAYRLPINRQPHQTVAVSIPYQTPHLAQYLQAYRLRFGLPPCGHGCLRIVNQAGYATRLPASSLGTGWDLEATLDVSMISAACPHCKILVVEARSSSFADLAQTDDTAARLGAQVISNSYGQAEDGDNMTFARGYRHPGHMIVAEAGNNGFDTASFPASLATVTAVGGTQLARAHTRRGFAERAWNAGGSSCSAYVPRPAWQPSPHCPGRTTADVSAVASDIPIYDRAQGGWLTVAGTGASASLIAGIYGLAGHAARITVRHLYRHSSDFFDITRGNNALTGSPLRTCGDDYLCTAKKGYDAPTGLGTPDGINAF